MNTTVDNAARSKIVVVGSDSMQNKLMLSFLQESLGLDCMDCSPRCLGKILEKKSERVTLFLFDIQDADLDVLLRSLDAGTDTDETNNLAVAYNVDPHTKMDEGTRDCALHGVFYRGEPLELLSQGIHSIINGHKEHARRMLSKDISARRAAKRLKGELSKELTAREKQVLVKIHSGDTNKKIAEDLGITFHTVKSHVYSIFRKLNVNNRFQATLWAAHNL